ncbi:MAG: hypothetical protein HOO06_13965 [Bdellovibrionaceae bacterium]|jgi:hypothetical protein|nr:hypothetical protein [Pseudobdellovibrionaceae bacterium]
MKKIIVILMMMSLGQQARASEFLCQGLGKYKQVVPQKISLDRSSEVKVPVLLTEDLKVWIGLDQAGTESSFFLSIYIEENNYRDERIRKMAKGSVKDIVIYSENVSFIMCAPIINP